jgi:hypothetical protein
VNQSLDGWERALGEKSCRMSQSIVLEYNVILAVEGIKKR